MHVSRGRQLPLTTEKCSHTILTPGVPESQDQPPNRARAASVVVSSGTSRASGFTLHNRFDGSVPEQCPGESVPMLKKQNIFVLDSLESSIKIVTPVTEVACGLIGPC